MKQVLFGTFLILNSAAILFAQTLVLSPVAETEMRDRSSIRIRSMELERIKRDSGKPRLDESSKELEIRFEIIKDDFENIQKLQNLIVAAYTRSREIDYGKIHKFAADIHKRSIRLENNLFSERLALNHEDTGIGTGVQYSLPNLIVELDNALGKFVSRPIFQNKKLVEIKESEASQLDLEKILLLSELLSKNRFRK